MSETPFRIAVSDGQLDLLRRKLELATFPDELEDAGWKYGAPLADIKRLVARWKNGYDWRKYEKELNDELSMFTRDINVDDFGTLDIHYVHTKSTVTNAMPLLYCHGCMYPSLTCPSRFLYERLGPGTFYEARKMIPLLTASSRDHPSFHVVALSLPGYEFSEAPRKQGFGFKQYAKLSSGYNEYVTQGGDWEYVIMMEHIMYKAWHTDFLLSLASMVAPLVVKEKEGLARTEWFIKQGGGYIAEHATQPQTLGYSPTDSPVGLLAWLYEKLHVWTDDYPWEDDEALTWLRNIIPNTAFL
ncbi:alpha beta-hydrolase [Tylopilus felleus]